MLDFESLHFDEIRNIKMSHFIKRLMERFALTIKNEELEIIIKEIENYSPPPLKIEEDGKSFHMVEIQETAIIVLYDWEYRAILTCYHNGWLAPNNEGKWEQVKRYKSKNIRKHNKNVNFRKKLIFYKD